MQAEDIQRVLDGVDVIIEDHEIDRLLDDHPHIIRQFQSLTMEPTTMTFVQGASLAAILDVHDGGWPLTRQIVQRAMFRAGHTTINVFVTAPVIAFVTTSIEDTSAEGRGEVRYLNAEREAQLWSRLAARAPDVRR